MWRQSYTPVAGSLVLSTIAAAIPLIVLFVMLGIKRKPAWMAAASGLGSALIVAVLVFKMPAQMAAMSTLYGAAFGMLPISWIVFSSILLYRLAVETGQFEVIKDSVGNLTNDRRLQALFIAFSFGAFIEGAAGFGAPVAVSGAMLAGLGFPAFYAAGLCLLANTAPVAFGSIGIPVTTLASVTGLPVMALSSMIGRLCAMVSIVIPGYLIVVMTGGRKALGVWPAILVCGVSFAGAQFYVSNYLGPELTDIISSLTCIGAMVLVLNYWRPKEIMRLDGDQPVPEMKQYRRGEIVRAWSPYILLVIFVLIWGEAQIKAGIDRMTTLTFEIPLLHQMVVRVPPVTAGEVPYTAIYTFNWLSAAGTACFLAAVMTALVLRVKPSQFAGVYKATLRQLALPLVTISCMLGLAYLMNYAGMTSTLGLALARTGVVFPFFSAVLGWMGVFLTGSDTSANALFGNLQVVTAHALDLNPVLTASVNSAAGVMGKMISLQSIAVAVAATGLSSADESKLFRFTIKHSLFLMTVMGIISMVFAYLLPDYVPTVPAE